ncbi:MAG: hypothetical protein C5B49_03200 [Bdellovibrio sp.]|nr:MAG: hypothetical protein C5B49_03200 [Bdellovibrio sp.]
MTVFSGSFDLDRALRWGGLPLVVQSQAPQEVLRAYLFTYLKEEIQEEGLVRMIDPFVRFLEVAGLLNGQVLNFRTSRGTQESSGLRSISGFPFLRILLSDFDCRHGGLN